MNNFDDSIIIAGKSGIFVLKTRSCIMSEYEQDPQSSHSDVTPPQVPLRINAIGGWGRKSFRQKDYRLGSLLRDGFTGLGLEIVGAVILWVGISKPLNFKVVAGGVGVMLLGLWSLALALRGWRSLTANSLPESQNR